VAAQAQAGESVSVRGAASAPVSCSFWNGNDPENDFWGTKENFGEQTGGTIDAGMSAAWDVIGGVPVVGALASGGVDLAKAGLAGATGTFLNWEADAADLTGTGSNTAARLQGEKYNQAASRFMHDTEFDMVGAIPGVGTALGAVSFVNDIQE